MGHSRAVTCVAMRPYKPYLVVTASDDMSVNVYTGPPYRFAKSIHGHSRFVTAIAFSPDGSMFGTAGADGRIILYGSDSQTEGTILTHPSAVIDMAWADNDRLFACYSDGSLLLWTISDRLGATSTGVSVPGRCLGLQADERAVIGLFGDGRMCRFSADGTGLGVLMRLLPTALADVAVGMGQGLAMLHSGGKLCEWSDDVSGSMNVQVDCTKVLFHRDELLVLQESGAVRLARTNKQLEIGHGVLDFCSNQNQLLLLGMNRLSVMQEPGRLKSVEVTGGRLMAANESMCVVVDGNSHLHLFDVGSLGLIAVLRDATLGKITSLALNQDFLAIGNDQRAISIRTLPGLASVPVRWTYHASTLLVLIWLGDGYLVTGSVDGDIFIWSPAVPTRPLVQLRAAHLGPVSMIRAESNSSFISYGQDGVLRTWEIKVGAQ